MGKKERKVETNRYSGSTSLARFQERLYRIELVENLNGKTLEKLKKMKIYFNIHIRRVYNPYSNRLDWQIVIIPTKGFPSISIYNVDFFLNYLRMYGFLPILEDIVIEDGNKKIKLTKFIKVSSLIYILKLFININTNFPLPIFEEVSKIIKEIDDKEKKRFFSLLSTNDINTIFNTLGQLSVNIKNIIEINGYKYQRIQNLKNLFPEIIFTEIAFKYENFIRETLNIRSTYLSPASLVKDIKEKTDMEGLIGIKKEVYPYRIQFFAPCKCSKKNYLRKLLKKEKDIKDGLKKTSNQLDEFFFLLTPNSNINANNNDIKKAILQFIFNENNSREIYLEKNQFPLFINKLLFEDIKEYLACYILLHLFPFDKFKTNNKSRKSKIKFLSIEDSLKTKWESFKNNEKLEKDIRKYFKNIDIHIEYIYRTNFLRVYLQDKNNIIASLSFLIPSSISFT